MSKKQRMKYSPQSPTCDTSEPPPRLVVAPEAYLLIEQLARDRTGKETGGILIGFHDGKDIRVVKATDEGPNAQRSTCGFLRDTRYCQTILGQEHAASGADYVGEWHTHVIDLPRPSGGDLLTLARIILDPDYNFPSFSMILAINRHGVSEVQGYMVEAEAAPDVIASRGNFTRALRVTQVTPEIEGSTT
jgi:integrative and conjugative element protein (TIGR02256 family)